MIFSLQSKSSRSTFFLEVLSQFFSFLLDFSFLKIFNLYFHSLESLKTFYSFPYSHFQFSIYFCLLACKVRPLKVLFLVSLATSDFFGITFSQFFLFFSILIVFINSIKFSLVFCFIPVIRISKIL